ncbi:MAG: hypothetical protein AAF652_07855 [Cyanobacteria bacterium P01_C01_bin.72]
MSVNITMSNLWDKNAQSHNFCVFYGVGSYQLSIISYQFLRHSFKLGFEYGDRIYCDFLVIL